MVICFSFARAQSVHARFVLDFSANSAFTEGRRPSRYDLCSGSTHSSGMLASRARAAHD